MQEHYLLIIERIEESKIFLMCLGDNLERKREGIYPGNAPKFAQFLFFFFFYLRGSGGIYNEKKVTFQWPSTWIDLIKAFPSLN